MQPSTTLYFHSDNMPPPPPTTFPLSPLPPSIQPLIISSSKRPTTSHRDVPPAKRPRTFWDTVLLSPALSSIPDLPSSSISDNLGTAENESETVLPSQLTTAQTEFPPPLCTSPLSEHVRSSSPPFLSTLTSDPGSYSGLLYQDLENSTNDTVGLQTSSKSLDESAGKIGTKPHSCEKCLAKFARLSHLRLHVRTIHEKQKPFRCGECSATFGHISSKYRHYRTVHLKRRDFSCSKCGQTFAERSAVQKHCRTVHEGCRPYPCHICGFRFHFKLHLDQHVATVHDKLRPHACTVCDARFGQRSSLNRHYRQIHGSAVTPALSGGIRKK